MYLDIWMNGIKTSRNSEIKSKLLMISAMCGDPFPKLKIET